MGKNKGAAMALSRYETELTDLLSEVEKLISKADAESNDSERSATLDRANSKLGEEHELYEMCEMEACSPDASRRLQQYRARAEELRKKLADSISGASRSELFGGMSGGAAQPQSHQEVSGKVSLAGDVRPCKFTCGVTDAGHETE